MTTNFDIAPPPVTVDGLDAVPIDIDKVSATLVLDAGSATATGDATFSFVLGPNPGCPIFDLRQNITSAWLDGVAIAPTLLALHDFGGGTNAELRILAQPLAAGSAHTVRVKYDVGTPIASPITIDYSAGPRVVFRFAFSDLNPARYLEQWAPSNLLFDQFEIDIDLQITGTAIAHSIITTGAVTNVAANHWSVVFPARSSALSAMLEVRPTDTVTTATSSVVLPISGTTVTLELWKAATSTIDLAAEASALAGFLSDDETAFGPYLHGNRFVAWMSDAGGGMEYEGGTTAATFALQHETRHSWFGRGVKPASQPDGWWDEAWDVYMDDGGMGALAFDFSAPPTALAPRNPWSRITQLGAYSDGERVFQGIAALVSPAALRSYMREFYLDNKPRPTSTGRLEGLLLARSGQALVVDAFDRFVYGFESAAEPPDLWLRDAVGDPGANQWNDTFWNSPDVWVRNHDDGGLAHQAPITGQDNFLYARVRNAAIAGPARHFAVAFNVKHYAGIEFVYPGDFLPCIDAAVAYDLAPGASTIVKVRWPAAQVPAAGTHHCVLVAALAQGDQPVAGRHVWEHNNLAQRNVTIAKAKAGEFIIVPFVLAAAFDQELDHAWLAVHGPSHGAEVSLVALAAAAPPRWRPPDLEDGSFPARVEHVSDEQWLAKSGEHHHVAVHVTRGRPRLLGLKVRAPVDAKPGTVVHIDLVKLDRERRRPVGGIAVELHIMSPRGGS